MAALDDYLSLMAIASYQDFYVKVGRILCKMALAETFFQEFFGF